MSPGSRRAEIAMEILSPLRQLREVVWDDDTANRIRIQIAELEEKLLQIDG